MQPICKPCGRFYTVKENGILFAKTCKMKINGIEEERPYQIYMADLYVCPNCNHETISGVGQKPIVEHFQEQFYETLPAVTIFIK